MGAVNKDSVLGASLILSLVSLVLLFGVTCYFQTSLVILQQQVLELQEQATAKSQDESRIQNVVRRQTSDGSCQCKDGLPGPRGPEGRKGEQGTPGQKGDVGEVGPRGPVGDQGFPGMKGRAGEKGNQGDQGFPGPRGVLGLKGSQGSAGQKGDPGENGSPGLKGDNGTKGDKGDAGEKGAGEKGEKGSQGEVGSPGSEGSRGRRGEKGDPGEQGLPGEKGNPGIQGPPGPKGDVGNAVDIVPTSRGKSQLPDDFDVTSVGSVYIRWGNNECPDTASLVYDGIAGGARFKDKGSGVNPQCLPWNPAYRPSSGVRDDIWSATIYGSEYQLHGQLGSASHQGDVPCAVCHTNRSAQFMLPAQYQCPTGWTTEYDGYLMSSRHDLRRTEYTCVDGSFKPVQNSSQNKDGFLFYPVQGRCGSLPCSSASSYDETKELTCAVCTK